MATSQPDAIASHPPLRLGRAGFLALIYSSLVVSVFQTMVIPLLPRLSSQLHVSEAAASWVLTINLMAAAICAPLLGRLGDMFGKRGALMAGLGLLGGGALLSAATTSYPLLLAGRAMQGTASAIVPLGMTIVADEWPAERVRRGIGWLSAMLGSGAALGMVACGVLTSASNDYHVVFWGGSAFSAVAVAVVLLSVPPSPHSQGGRIDAAGGLLLGGWLTALLLGVAQTGSKGAADPEVLGLFGGAVVGAVLWNAVGRRTRQPLVDPRQVFEHRVLTANAMSFFSGFGIYGSVFLLTALVQAPTTTEYGLGLSILGTGLVMIPQASGNFIGAQLAGRLTSLSTRAVAGLGALLMALDLAWLGLVHGSLWQLLTANLLVGIGGGMALAALPAIVIDAVPAADTGVATGVNTVLRTVGGSVAAAVLGAVLSVAPQGHTGGPPASAYAAAFLLCGGLSAVAAALAPLAASARLPLPNAAPANRVSAIRPGGRGGQR